MIRDRRKLQFYTSLTLSILVLGLGFLSSFYALGQFRSTMERQMAEDSEIISENLRIFINQVTQKYSDRDMSLAQIQKVLEAMKGKEWIGFACVLDKNGRVLAHPKPEFVDMQVPLQTYEPTELLGPKSPPIDSLGSSPNAGTTKIYRTEADIIAIQWLPELMTYLCVHQPTRALNQRIVSLGQTLTAIGLLFTGVVAFGSWFFVGWLVNRYESHLSRSESRNRILVQNSAPILVVSDSGQILDANPQSETLFRFPRASLLAMNLENLWPSGQRDHCHNLLANVNDAEIVELNDLDLQTSQSTKIPVHL